MDDHGWVERKRDERRQREAMSLFRDRGGENPWDRADSRGYNWSYGFMAREIGRTYLEECYPDEVSPIEDFDAAWGGTGERADIRKALRKAQKALDKASGKHGLRRLYADASADPDDGSVRFSVAIELTLSEKLAVRDKVRGEPKRGLKPELLVAAMASAGLMGESYGK